MVTFAEYQSWEEIQQIVIQNQQICDGIADNAGAVAEEIIALMQEQGLEVPNPVTLQKLLSENTGQIISAASWIGLIGGDFALMSEFGLPFAGGIDDFSFFNSLGSTGFALQKAFGMMAPNEVGDAEEMSLNDKPLLSKIRTQLQDVKDYSARHKGDSVMNIIFLSQLMMLAGYGGQFMTGVGDVDTSVVAGTTFAALTNAMMVGVNYRYTYDADDEHQPLLPTGRITAELLEKMPDFFTREAHWGAFLGGIVGMGPLIALGIRTGNPNFIIGPSSILASIIMINLAVGAPETEFETLNPDNISQLADVIFHATKEAIGSDINECNPERADYVLQHFRHHLVDNMMALPFIHPEQQGYIEQEFERALTESFPEFYLTRRVFIEVDDQHLPLSEQRALLPISDIRSAQVNALNVRSARLLDSETVECTFTNHVPPHVNHAMQLINSQMPGSIEQESEGAAVYTVSQEMLSAVSALSDSLKPYIEGGNLYVDSEMRDALVSRALDIPESPRASMTSKINQWADENLMPKPEPHAVQWVI